MSQISPKNYNLSSIYDKLTATLDKQDADNIIQNMQAAMSANEEKLTRQFREKEAELDTRLSEYDARLDSKDTEISRLHQTLQSRNKELTTLREQQIAQKPAQASFSIPLQSNEKDKKRIVELEKQLEEARTISAPSATTQTEEQFAAREKALLERIAAQEQLIDQQGASLQQSEKANAVLKAEATQANRSAMDARDELEASKRYTIEKSSDSTASLEDELRASLQDELATQFAEKQEVIGKLEEAVDVTRGLAKTPTPENKEAATKFAEEATALLEEQKQKHAEMKKRIEELEKKNLELEKNNGELQKRKAALEGFDVITLGSVEKKSSLFQRLFGKKQKKAPAPDKQYLVNPHEIQQASTAAPKKESWLSRVFNKKGKPKDQVVVAVKGIQSVDSFVEKEAQRQAEAGERTAQSK